MNISILKIMCLTLLINCLFFSHADAYKNKPEGHTLGHYIVHSVVQGIGGTAIVVGSAVGTALGGGITVAARDPLVAMAGVATVIGSVAGGVYSIYRLPQWTDTYFLDYETERNTTQNVICFWSKIFLWPGVVVGEFIAHLDGVAPEAQ